ncbi:hypothetical protein LMG19089_02223 [Ralstonia edaphis]|uniref:Uncharacterized protein n=1 Tax=Ralstonia edaphi TaxID=3058599 RepID=A0AB72X5M6_9RALS|nr:hypothetical protein LMG19089_02223 [Ralstonia sp. LMG 6871]CAJ0739263.1 hypothetical protein R16034_01547 [Ralstonia sp. LMG 6871]
MYGRKKTANRRSYPPAIFSDANPRSRCVRDGPQYSPGGMPYLCQMVMQRWGGRAQGEVGVPVTKETGERKRSLAKARP